MYLVVAVHVNVDPHMAVNLSFLVHNMDFIFYREYRPFNNNAVDECASIALFSPWPFSNHGRNHGEGKKKKKNESCNVFML